MRAALTLAVAIASVALASCSSAPREARPTRAQIDELAAKLATIMPACRAMPVTELFDLEQVRTRIAPRQATPPSVAELADAVPRFICDEHYDPDVRYVRTTDRVVNGVVRPCFRIENSNRGLTYHELELAVGADGKARIVDLYLYEKGEWLTEVVRMAVDDGLPALDERAARRAPLIDAGERGDRDAVRRAAAEIRSKYPDDTSVDLITIELSFTFRDPALKLEATDRLRRRLGDDGWLLTVRSIAFCERGEMVECHRIAHQAAEAAPHLIETARHLIWRQIAIPDYAAAVRSLERARRHQPNFDEAWYAGPARWPDFAASPEYAAWKAAAR